MITNDDNFSCSNYYPAFTFLSRIEACDWNYTHWLGDLLIYTWIANL